MKEGSIVRINGSLIIAEKVPNAKIGDITHLGEMKLIGEIVRIFGDKVAIQCYEDTSGLRPGDVVINTEKPLVAELGPGLLGGIFDGLEISELKLWDMTGAFIKRGVKITPLDRDKKWDFTPTVKKGDKVVGGDIIGTVPETSAITHRIMVPLDLEGTIEEVYEGKFTITEPVAILRTPSGEKKELTMMQTWPVRKPRPVKARLPLVEPLITGQRVIDTFFPIAKGGTGAIPGGFGTGKCVLPGTPVLLASGELVPIEHFYRMAKNIIKDGEEEIGELENIRVISFDGTKMVFKKATHIYKGKTDKIVAIRTKGGRNIKVTPTHKLIVFNPEGYLEEKPAIYLKEGDYIAVPRRIPTINEETYLEINVYDLLPEARIRDKELLKDVIELIDALAKKYHGKKKIAKLLDVSYDQLISYYTGKNYPTVRFIERLYNLARQPKPPISRISITRSKKEIRVPETFNEDFAEFLGLLLSDGMITKKELRFFNNNNLLLDRFIELSKQLFDIKPKAMIFKTVRGLTIRSTILVRLLQKLDVPLKRKYRNVIVPKIVLKSPKNVIAAFIRGYYLGDGSFDKSAIEISSASHKLVEGLAYLLSILGILYTISRRKSQNDDYQYRIIISGKKEISKFAKIVLQNSPNLDKVLTVYEYLKSKAGGRITRDIVPISSDALKEIVKGFSRRYLENRGIWIQNYVKKNEKLTSTSLLKLAETTKDEHLLNLVQAFEWIYLDPIKEIKIIEKEYEVYDITVEDTHNFVGGEIPIILHNTVTLHQLAKWSDADIIVYIGCGERGNEMADVITHFPSLKDPRTGKRLDERSIFIANVSNLPVFAREASIYMGVTIAEYYRDQGYHVALMADSTSRWAEALRDISGRLEEIPVERGYPAYLAERIAEFYERAGLVLTLGSKPRKGSLTIMGAVSPPGADFSEPVTSITIRFVGTLWALDKELAFRRHFPAINWLLSFSKYIDILSAFWQKHEPKWTLLRKRAMGILEEASKIEETARVIGEKALPDDQRLVLLISEILREGFLFQNAFHDVDTYCDPRKQAAMLRAIIEFYDMIKPLVDKGVPIEKIRELRTIVNLKRMREHPELDWIDRIMNEARIEILALAREYEISITI